VRSTLVAIGILLLVGAFVLTLIQRRTPRVPKSETDVPAKGARHTPSLIAPLLVFFAAASFGLALGVDPKSWWERALGSVGGGLLGAIGGIGFFVLVGAIGWVSGPLFGAIGLLGLFAGGALSGMGLGAIVDIFRRPGNYHFDAVTLLLALAIGLVAAWWLYRFVDRKSAEPD
jgi:hypothetical protein